MTNLQDAYIYTYIYKLFHELVIRISSKKLKFELKFSFYDFISDQPISSSNYIHVDMLLTQSWSILGLVGPK